MLQLWVKKKPGMYRIFKFREQVTEAFEIVCQSFEKDPIPNRSSIHFLQESVRYHFQDFGRQLIILAGIVEDLGRKCLTMQDLAKNVKILEVTWNVPRNSDFK